MRRCRFWPMSRHPKAAEALIQAAVRRYGRLDILVCNAGVNVKKKAIDFTPAEFDTVIGGNLSSYFLCAQAAARQFIAQGTGGAIVMNSSNASVAAFEDLTPYCAAKGGVDMLVRGLASEWGPHGIRVNAFNPGYTKHSMTAEGQAYLAEAEKEIVARTPLRRMAEMKEMVGPCHLPRVRCRKLRHRHDPAGRWRLVRAVSAIRPWSAGPCPSDTAR